VPTVDFCFDYLSPYAYLASLEIPELCRRTGAELRMRPVLFAGLLDHWGQRGPAEIPPKGRHGFRECLRHALSRGIPLRSPRHHPFRPLTSLRVSLAEVSGKDQPLAIRTLFTLGWARGGDLGSDAEISAALDAAGLDGRALLERAARPDAKARLREETEAAIARGVFGIPTMLVGDELFWGLDQLRWLELHLRGEDPLARVDLEALRGQGPAAWRTGVTRHEG
jgi:2-hydroxychromene-2-carboxylate isomerase